MITKGQFDFRIGSDERHPLEPGYARRVPTGFPYRDGHFGGDPRHGRTWIPETFAPPDEDYRE